MKILDAFATIVFAMFLAAGIAILLNGFGELLLMIIGEENLATNDEVADSYISQLDGITTLVKYVIGPLVVVLFSAVVWQRLRARHQANKE